MTAKCLMLDVDGVLISGRPCDGQPWTVGLFDDLGLSPDDLVRGFFRTAWNDVVLGRANLLPTLREALGRIAPSIEAADLIAYWFEKDSRIVQSVLLDVQEARQGGMPVYLATNQEHLRAQYLMETLGLKASVDGIVYSAKAGHKKPEAGFYAFAQETTGFGPRELIMVDDTLENVEAARRAGWSAFHWAQGDSLSEILRRNIASS